MSATLLRSVLTGAGAGAGAAIALYRALRRLVRVVGRRRPTPISQLNAHLLRDIGVTLDRTPPLGRDRPHRRW